MLKSTVASKTDVSSPSKPNMNRPNTEHEQAEHHDPVRMHFLHQILEVLRPIDVLVHAFERLSRDRLETDAQHRAAALGGEFEHAVVLRELGGDAGLPMEATPLQRAHHFLGTLRRAKKV